MIDRNKTTMLMLIFILGMGAFFVHADAENAEDGEVIPDVVTSEETETTKEKSQAKADPDNLEDISEIVKQVDEVLDMVKETTEASKKHTDDSDFESLTETIKELLKGIDYIEIEDFAVIDPTEFNKKDGVKVYILRPSKNSKILKVKDLASVELTKHIKELVELETDSEKILDSNNIKVFNKDVSISAKIMIDSKDVDMLTEEIVNFTKELAADSDELSKQIEQLLKKHSVESKVMFGVGDGMVIELKPSGSVNVHRNEKRLEELRSQLKKLHEDVEPDELIEAIKKLVEKGSSDSTTILDTGNVKVYGIKPDKSLIVNNYSNEIDALKNRIAQLEKKIDKLSQKLDTDNDQSSDTQK